jgi:hypothetical protein
MEVELTSARDDGTWTWRAAGAKQPKGVLDAALLPSGASVGDVVKAEVDVSLDGVEITAITSGGRERREPQRLELLDRRRDDEPLVTTTLAPKGRGGRPRGRGRDDRPRGDRSTRPGGPRGERGERKARGPRPDASNEARGRRPERERREPRQRPARSGPPPAPRAKRLRPSRTHRKAFVATLPAEQQPVAEQVLLGGIPAVRQAIDKQNEQARTEGRPEVSGEELVALAEKLAPKLRVAEWRDRAEAALADLDELDLRDLRSVVVASDANARDDESRALATQLREGLTRRVEAAQTEWLAEITTALDEGRVVRALRLSSRPPKAGAPFPPDLATRLAEAAEASLTLDAAPDRWAHVLDALSFSPVRLRVQPKEVPAEPGPALREAVQKVAARLPDLAARFGVTAAPAPAKARGGRSGARRPLPPKPDQGGGAARPSGAPPAKPDQSDEAAPSSGAPQPKPQEGADDEPAPAARSTPEPSPAGVPQGDAAVAQPSPAPSHQ